MSEAGLIVDKVVVEYPGGFRLGPLNLTLQAGHTYGIVGKNGAGKSTFFETISGNLDYRGQVIWSRLKIHPEAADNKRNIGYLPQRHRLPLWASPYDIVRYVRSIQGLESDVEAMMGLLSYWGCDQYAKKPLVTLSHGMRKRVSLTLASVNQPSLLILDEPFSGLDLFYIKKLQDLISGRRLQGLTTIFSTHIVPFLSEFSDKIYLLANGEIKEYEAWHGKSDVVLTSELKDLIGGEA